MSASLLDVAPAGVTTVPVIPFHTYLWKVASRCNLNCTYCYVYNLSDQRWRNQPHFMSEEVARQVAGRILEHCRAHSKQDIRIIFHGGEPLLGGLSHLRMLLGVIDSTFAGTGVEVRLGMQSNGLLFTEEIGDFMLAHRMNVGVSSDGPPKYNDLHRVDHQGRSSSAMLEQKVRILLSPKYRPVFAGFLCVIDITTDPVEVFDYLHAFDPGSIDFLFPLDNYDRRPRGKEHDLRATPYGDWLIAAFDRWWTVGGTSRVRIFNSIVRQVYGLPSLVESLGIEPVDLVVVETNGDIEAVDSLKSSFEGATSLGYNAFTHAFDEVARDAAVQRRQLGIGVLSETCRQCHVVKICGGGYIPHRFSSANGFDNPSIYSTDLEKLILHIHRVVSETLAREMAEVEATA
jgi:uncharacterized protein